MSYGSALEAAGAKILAMKHFGSWQGDWWAKIALPSGSVGWTHGWFGSCSHCDAFQSEFGYESGLCEEHQYEDAKTPCEACAATEASYQARLKAFGERYLDDLYTQEEAEREANRDSDWDGEASQMLAWLKANA